MRGDGLGSLRTQVPAARLIGADRDTDVPGGSVTVIAIGVVWYVAALMYNRSRGIDVSLAYAEIPPE